MKIIIAGDFAPQHRVATNIEMGDYSCLDEVKTIIANADFAIVNLESPVVECKASPVVKSGPNLRCTAKAVECISKAGFRGVTLANNHFLDYGEEGVKDTLSACKSMNINVMGGGVNLREASTIFYCDIDGERLAIINCCEHEFSIATQTTAGSNPLNPIQQYYSVQEAKSNADYVLVIVHGGHEHFQLPSPRMVETYRFFIDAGADAVINHHQHCFSGYEVYHGKPIFYGIGNFCFDRLGLWNTKWNEGYMVELNFKKEIRFTIFPYNQCSEDPKVKMLNDNAYTEPLLKLNGIIGDSKRLKEEVERFFMGKEKTNQKLFEPIQNRYWNALLRRGLLPSFFSNKRRLKVENHVCCESLRDGLIYYLSKQK